MLTVDDVHAAAERLTGRLLTTPLMPAPELSARMDRPVWLKLESLQTTGSFKPRGALNWLLAACLCRSTTKHCNAALPS